jgi:hypothetical protein
MVSSDRGFIRTLFTCDELERFSTAVNRSGASKTVLNELTSDQ